MSNGAGGGDPRERARAWLGQKQQVAEASYCPFCRATNWTVGDLVGAPNLVPGGYDADNLLPSFPLICTGCGYTMFFNAVVAGVVQPGAPGGPHQLPPSGS